MEGDPMRRLILSLVAAHVLCVVPAFAHGDLVHILGTVSSVDGSHLIVNTKAGKAVRIEVNEQTTYLSKNAEVDRDALKVGDRVVVEVEEKAGNLIAGEIRFATPAKPS